MHAALGSGPINLLKRQASLSIHLKTVSEQVARRKKPIPSVMLYAVFAAERIIPAQRKR